MPAVSSLPTITPPSESVNQFPEKGKNDESLPTQSPQSTSTSSPGLPFDSNGPTPPPSGVASSKSTSSAPIEKMFETFHQSPTGEFKPTFYNPFEVKHRRRTSKSQFRVLERAFMTNPKPTADVRATLAAKLNMTTRSIQVWFQNRRAKLKNQLKEGKIPLPGPSYYNTESESSEGECETNEENDIETRASTTGKRSLPTVSTSEMSKPQEIHIPGPEIMPNGSAIPSQQRLRSHSLPDVHRSPQLPFRQLQEALFGNNNSINTPQPTHLPAPYGHIVASLQHCQPGVMPMLDATTLPPQIIPPMASTTAACFRFPPSTAIDSINPQQTFHVDPNRFRTRPRSSSFTLPRQTSVEVTNRGGLASISEQSPHGQLYAEASFLPVEEAHLNTQLGHADLDYYMALGQSAMYYNSIDYSSSASQSPAGSNYLLDPAEMAFLPQPSNEILLSTLIDDKHFE